MLRRCLWTLGCHLFNPFNGRMLIADSSTLRSLEPIGLGVVNDSHIGLVDAEVFDNFVADYLAGSATFPQKGFSRVMLNQLDAMLRVGMESRPSDKLLLFIEFLMKQKTIRPRSTVGPATDDDESPAAVLTRPALNDEQEGIANLATQGYNLIISGSAGTGKTVLLNEIYQRLRDFGLSVAMTATTGVAGCHVGGSTFHHTFGVTQLDEFVRTEELLHYDVVIVDEVSMLNTRLLENFDDALRRAAGSNVAFSGTQIILCGDFMQLEPVTGTPMFESHLVKECFLCIALKQLQRQKTSDPLVSVLQDVRKGKATPNVIDFGKATDMPVNDEDDTIVRLYCTNKAVNAENEKRLNAIPGEPTNFGVLIEAVSLDDNWTPSYVISCPDGFLHPVHADGISAFMREKVNLTYSRRSLYEVRPGKYVLRFRMPLSETKAWKDDMLKRFEELKEEIPKIIPGSEVEMAFQSGSGLHTPRDEQFLEQQLQEHVIAQPIQLKVGTRVMLRANLSATYVNGSVGTVVGFTECDAKNVSKMFLLKPKVEGLVQQYATYQQFLCGASVPQLPVVRFNNGKDIVIPPWSFSVGGAGYTNYYSCNAIALPLSLGYSFTVHKVQGLTLTGRVHLELNDMWECNHLLYVGLSRVKTADQLTMSNFTVKSIAANSRALEFDRELPSVHEVVVPSLLLPALWKRTCMKRIRSKKAPSGVTLRKLKSVVPLEGMEASSLKGIKKVPANKKKKAQTVQIEEVDPIPEGFVFEVPQVQSENVEL